MTLANTKLVSMLASACLLPIPHMKLQYYLSLPCFLKCIEQLSNSHTWSLSQSVRPFPLTADRDTVEVWTFEYY